MAQPLLSNTNLVGKKTLPITFFMVGPFYQQHLSISYVQSTFTHLLVLQNVQIGELEKQNIE